MSDWGPPSRRSPAQSSRPDRAPPCPPPLESSPRSPAFEVCDPLVVAVAATAFEGVAATVEAVAPPADETTLELAGATGEVAGSETGGVDLPGDELVPECSSARCEEFVAPPRSVGAACGGASP